jgi:ataxia telangiectasia mutated family protein
MSRQDLYFGDLVARIKGSQHKDRSNAVLDLKQVVRQHERTEVIASVKDKEWNEVFEALFQASTTESNTYIKGRYATRKPTTSRLSECAGTIRAVTQESISRLRIKTVKSILDHIIKTLPDLVEDADLDDLVWIDYAKTLRCILDHQPHVEHLREPWNDVMSFCLLVLDLLQGDDTERDHPEDFSSARSSSRLSRLGTPRVTNRRRFSGYGGNATNELIACVRQLCRAPNAPLQGHALAAGSTMVRHLVLSKSSGPGHLDALASINIILTRTCQDRLDWTRELLLNVLPAISTLWEFKERALREDILVFLTIVHRHLKSLLQEQPNHSVRVYLERFLDCVQEDYGSRLTRDQLKLDDLLLQHGITYSQHVPAAGAFTLKPGFPEAEYQWMTVYFIAWITTLLDEAHPDLELEDTYDEGSHKRQRLTSHLHGLRRLSTSTDMITQISALQALTFVTATKPLSQVDLESVVESFMTTMSHANTSIASWSMLGLANCALQVAASETLHDMWSQVWELGSRTIPSQNISRAACLLLGILIRKKHVQYSAISKSLENMLQFSELTGPGVIADSTISFWITSIRAIIDENPGGTRGIYEKPLQWLLSKWKPSKLSDIHLI